MKEIITQHDTKCHNVSHHDIPSQELTKENIFNSWADWIREFEPYDWFATFTFKTDILTYSQNHPVVRCARYSWHDKTGRYPHGTYVRETTKHKWTNKDDYERVGQYVDKVQHEHSEKMYKRWIRNLNIEIHGKRYREKNLGVTHVYAIEYQKRGVAHLHSLIKGITASNILRKDWEKVWEGLHPNNGFCNIFPYDPVKGAAGYIGKYILKEGYVTFDGPSKHA